jgi:hypothetical protein
VTTASMGSWPHPEFALSVTGCRTRLPSGCLGGKWPWVDNNCHKQRPTLNDRGGAGQRFPRHQGHAWKGLELRGLNTALLGEGARLDLVKFRLTDRSSVQQFVRA